MAERMIVIGGTAAGLSAATKAKRLKPDMEIIAFEKTGFISYGACGLPYFIGGLIDDPEELVSLSVADMKNKRGIIVHTHQEAIRIDRQKKEVTVQNLDTEEILTHPYDKLVIATGATPVHPDIPGIEAEGVYFLRNVEDGIKLKGDEHAGQSIVVIGGGFIGLETAEQLAKVGLHVTILEALPRLLPFLPEEYSSAVVEELRKNNVEVRLDAKVSRIQAKSGKVSAIELNDGETIPCDAALVSVGVVPATDLAKSCGLELGIKGSIVVDDTMLTNDPSIWACGDCAQMKHILTGLPCYIPLGTTANKMGRIAGTNIGGGHAVFPGVLGSMVTQIFDLSIASTGFSLAEAIRSGYGVAQSSIIKNDRASYYPGAQPNRINLVVDTASGRLLGAQAIGSTTIAGRINTLCACITAAMTVSQISQLDLVYAPPFAPVYDPILIAANQAEKLVEA